MTFTTKNVLSAIPCIWLLAACSPFPERPPTSALHDFGSSEKLLASTAGDSDATMWSAVSVDAPVWLQDENIRYRLLYAEPSRVRFYAQDRWLAPPSAMLAQRLSLVGNRQGLRLKIKLFEFEQVFDDSQRARMRLVFRAFALRRDSEDMVGEKLFNLSLPTPSTDAKGAVTASALLMDEAVDLLQVWFKGLSEQR